MTLCTNAAVIRTCSCEDWAPILAGRQPSKCFHWVLYLVLQGGSAVVLGSDSDSDSDAWMDSPPQLEKIRKQLQMSDGAFVPRKHATSSAKAASAAKVPAAKAPPNTASPAAVKAAAVEAAGWSEVIAAAAAGGKLGGKLSAEGKLKAKHTQMKLAHKGEPSKAGAGSAKQAAAAPKHRSVHDSASSKPPRSPRSATRYSSGISHHDGKC